MCLFSSICKVNSKTQFSSIVACSISVLLWWTSSSADDRILNSWSSGKLCWMAELEEFFFLVEQCFSSRNYSRRSMRSNLGITSRGEEDTYFSSCSIWKCSPLKKTNQQVFFSVLSALIFFRAENFPISLWTQPSFRPNTYWIISSKNVLKNLLKCGLKLQKKKVLTFLFVDSSKIPSKSPYLVMISSPWWLPVPCKIPE